MASQRTSHPFRTFLIILILLAGLSLAVYIVLYEPADGPTATPAPATTPTDQPAEVNLTTWNLYNFGGSKTDEEIAFMAGVIRNADILAIQEVSTGPAGPEAVGRLADQLDRTGTDWDYAVSDPTSGEGSERYAFLWKAARIRLVGQPWLEATLAEEIDREPYMARFEAGRTGRRLLIANLHAVPTAKKPAEEIVLLDRLHHTYPDDNLVLVGDFNLSQKHYAWDGLKAAGYTPALVDQRTSLRRRRRDGEHLSQEYDNIFFEAAALRAETVGILDFTSQFSTLRQARTISDHIPIFMHVRWN